MNNNSDNNSGSTMMRRRNTWVTRVRVTAVGSLRTSGNRSQVPTSGKGNPSSGRRRPPPPPRHAAAPRRRQPPPSLLALSPALVALHSTQQRSCRKARCSLPAAPRGAAPVATPAAREAPVKERSPYSTSRAAVPAAAPAAARRGQAGGEVRAAAGAPLRAAARRRRSSV